MFADWKSRPWPAAFAVLLVPLAALAGVAPLGSAFQQVDVDGNGSITAAEFAAGSQRRFLAMDANGDGRVAAEEMAVHKGSRGDSQAAGTESTRGDSWELEQYSRSVIAESDRDGDGKLSAAEDERASAAMFPRLDRNRDGRVTEREFEAEPRPPAPVK